ncbi:MAG: polysaccharide deacetylase family protein [Solirubrobacterales bacterium]|nr:polysaccharide deacetylase family protein [Solirubrobacterales bacterium]
MARDMASLQARRLEARRRRRRRLERGLALLAVGFAVAAGIVWTTWSTGSSTHSTGGVIPRSAPIKVGPAPALAIKPHSALAAELAPVRRLASHGLPLWCGGRQRRMVALTFDDGPGVYTHYAIKKLREAHLPATFFLVGKSIAAWPGLAQREKSVATFGDHTMTHPFLPGLPYSEAVQEIAADQRLVERTVHEPVLLFRPPYGSRTPAIDAEVKRLGMVEVLWNVDSADSLGANYLGIEHNVIAGLRPGSIILMHENRGQTIRALDVIFAALRRRHLDAVTVPQLIAQDPPSLAQLREGYYGCPVRLSNGSGS